MMNDLDFVYATTYVRTMENKMLGRSDYEAMLGASSQEDALRHLADKGYGRRMDNARQAVDVDSVLREEALYAWTEVKGACPNGTPIEVFLYPNDFHNLKTILKAFFSDAEYAPWMLAPCSVPPDSVARAVTEGKLATLPDIIKAPAGEAYQILSKDGDGQLAEIALDKALFSVTRTIAEQAEDAFLIGWADLQIAVMDMKLALRAANSGKSKTFIQDAMLDCKLVNADRLADAAAVDVQAVLQAFTRSGYGPAAEAARESFAAFEKWCDNVRIQYVKTSKYVTFGFAPIFSFLVGKQYEIQSVRMILAGLRGGIPTEVLRERLRDMYV